MNVKYMKKSKLVFLLSFAWVLASCIQKEELNAEADILSCTILEEDILQGEADIFDSEEGKYNITLRIGEEANNSSLTPIFTLTEGATITPNSGEVQDFSKGPIEYVVTSQDKQWKKKYKILTVRNIPLNYPFEDLLNENGDKFDTFIEFNKNKEEVLRWASGNGGFAITGVTSDPKKFPTSQDPNGYKNNCVKLVTRSTGFFGTTVGMPLAAGNLFLGSFNIGDAISEPLTATRFGVPFTKIPLKITGYYKYTPGEKYMDGKTHIKDKVDQADIYGVLYDSDNHTITLDGGNSLIHKNIIALARPNQITPTTEWTRFEYDFIYKENVTIDTQKLQKGQYKLALVFSSSIDGATFKGAIGSTLHIDEVEVIIKK